MFVSDVVARTLGRLWRSRGWFRPTVGRISNLVSLFVDPALPLRAFETKRVQKSALVPLRRVRRGSKSDGRMAPGMVMRMSGRLVVVLRELAQVDILAVACSLDRHPWFAMGVAADAGSSAGAGSSVPDGPRCAWSRPSVP